ncbi:MAG: SSI family serine proteinase inhibitor [Actinomycetota bacterium]|nr:SSI family serine proteinase inhibitor [Actinomycetota bacterium]
MRNIRRPVLCLVAIPLAACSGGADTVAADPRTDLRIEIVRDEGAEPERLTLTCEPTGGDHPAAAQACADLAQASEPFAPLPPDQVCTEIFGGPQTATVTGTYRGEQVRLDLSRSDGCRIAQWDGLGAVLPGPA